MKKSKLQSAVDSLIELSKKTIADNKKELEESLKNLHLKNKLKDERSAVQIFFGDDEDEFAQYYCTNCSPSKENENDGIKSIEIRIIINGNSNTIFKYES